MKRFAKWAVAALVVLAIALALGRAYQARKTVPLQADRSQAVSTIELAETDVVPVQMRDITQGLAVSGTLKAVNSAIVKARVAGELQALTVREGDVVTAGQVLARIDDTEYRARLQQAQLQADASKAQVDIAQRQYNNNKALVDQGFISPTSLDTSLGNLQAAQATYRAALAGADVAGKALADAVLRAPLSGQVSQRLAQPGERMAIDARILEIVDLSRLELEASLAASESLALKPGQSAELRVEGASQVINARLARINPSTQSGSRSVLIYLSIDNPPGRQLPLRQGLFAEGTLGTGRSRALAVPLQSVRTDKVQPYVQIVSQGRLVHQSVEMGQTGQGQGQAGDEVIVAVKGLPEGALVVRASVGLLRDGSLVRFTPRNVGQPTASPAAAPVAAGAKNAP
jgi:RND family efflux transporter MFP subunit